MATPIQTQIDELNAAVATLNSSLNQITGNTILNYNQLTRISSQQGNILNSISNGNGNLTTGNVTVPNNITHYGFNYTSFTADNETVSIIPPSSLPEISCIQRFTLSNATSSTAYDILKLNYSNGNGAVCIVARIVGHLHYTDSTSAGIYQENRILIDSTNLTGDTSVATTSNGTPITIAKGASGVWTSCNISVNVATAYETLIRITPVFTGSESLSYSSLTVDWHIISTKSAFGVISISQIDFYQGV